MMKILLNAVKTKVYIGLTRLIPIRMKLLLKWRENWRKRSKCRQQARRIRRSWSRPRYPAQTPRGRLCWHRRLSKLSKSKKRYPLFLCWNSRLLPKSNRPFPPMCRQDCSRYKAGEYQAPWRTSTPLTMEGTDYRPWSSPSLATALRWSSCATT